MTLSERIRELRREKGETQVQVAQSAGLTTRQYQTLEAGTNFPNYKNFCALADHFGVTLDYLAGRSDER